MANVGDQVVPFALPEAGMVQIQSASALRDDSSPSQVASYQPYAYSQPQYGDHYRWQPQVTNDMMREQVHPYGLQEVPHFQPRLGFDNDTTFPVSSQEQLHSRYEIDRNVTPVSSIHGGATSTEDLLVRCSQVCASSDPRFLRQYVNTVNAEEVRLNTLIEQLRAAAVTVQRRLSILTGQGPSQRVEAPRNTASVAANVKVPARRDHVARNVVIPPRFDKRVAAKQVSVKPAKNNVSVDKPAWLADYYSGKIPLPKAAWLTDHVSSILEAHPKNASSVLDHNVASTSSVDVSNAAVSSIVSASAQGVGDSRPEFYVRSDYFTKDLANAVAAFKPRYTDDGRVYFERKYNRAVRTLLKSHNSKPVELDNKSQGRNMGQNVSARAPEAKVKASVDPIVVPDPRLADSKDWADISTYSQQSADYDNFMSNLRKRAKALGIPDFEGHVVHITRVIASTDALQVDVSRVPKLLNSEPLNVYFPKLVACVPFGDLFSVADAVCIRTGAYERDQVIDCYLAYLKDRVDSDDV